MKKTILITLLIIGMIFILAACNNNSLPADSSNPSQPKVVKMATKPMTEQLIISEILKALVENNTDITVEITKGIGGGTSNIHPALLKGEFDLYPEYTGTAWSFVLKKEGIPDDETLYQELTSAYASEYGLEWVGLYGFNNTYGILVREEIAQQYNLNTYSDLAPYTGELTFGAEYDFYEREDGYTALCSEYGYNFKKTVDLDIGLKYTAITNKQMDVMDCSTTDGLITASPVRLLEDDKHFFQTYYCGTVVRQDTLAKYPELKDALLLMNGIITEDEMKKLNYEVEQNKREDKDVALEFLQNKGLL